MKEEQKYNGSKTRNYFTAYLLASIRGKRLRYLEKQQKILFAEENLEDKEYTDADISPEERLELEQKEQLLMEEAQGIYPEWNEMTDMCYSILCICVTLLMGTPIAILICRQMSIGCYGKVVEYSFPFFYMSIYVFVLLLIQVILSIYQIREQKKKSIIDQLRME